MDELDLLKKDWKRENAFSQVSEKEIYAMLHKKSSSIVKWILIISILEVLLWTAMGWIPTSNEYLDKMHYEDYFRWFNNFNYAVTLVFIYLFYRNYVSISTTASTKNLMDTILRTRKTVKYYVWYNLTMIVISFIFGFILAFICNPDVDPLRHKVRENAGFMLIAILLMLFVVAVIAGIFWLFYRLVYGIFLRRLLSNYKELKKIDL